ncbi:MAG: dethiobiotin synthase [Deltaproteobacteria bacterium]|nr:MAG: dethiobiotin synthase [Deltaproteobacteria bacterium]
MKHGLFITGTDTGVGKTLVTAALASLLRAEGIDVGVMKPVESGCPRQKGKLVPQDALFLREAAGSEDDLELINPCRLEAPLAPSLAAEREGVEINLGKLIECFQTLKERHDFILVEGAGGLLVPLKERYLVSDLVQLFQLPLLIVAASRLGAVNHTLLTTRCAQSLKIEIVGVILNNLEEEGDTASRSNPHLLPHLLEVPLLCVIPFIPRIHELKKEKLAGLIKERISLSVLVGGPEQSNPDPGIS